MSAAEILQRLISRLEFFDNAPDDADVWIGGWSIAEATAVSGTVKAGEIRAALAARSAPEAGKAVVKPLEWEDAEFAGQARVVLGLTYSMRNGRDGWFVSVAGDYLPGDFETREEAKAAAQADFEQRILFALASVPAPSGADEWRPFETAPQEDSRRILAWCDAAESDSGVVEMVWTGKYWSRVIEDPWPNACLTPTHWRSAPESPKASE